MENDNKTTHQLVLAKKISIYSEAVFNGGSGRKAAGGFG
jgi:hypothetical protein